MQTLRSKRLMKNVSYVPVEEIIPGPMQPRRSFNQEGLSELRDSIAQHGVIQPLTVRVKGDRYELIAGERRLRAAKMAGLYEVPCIVMDIDLENSGVIALIENIQRSDLDFVEEAEGISRLIKLFGMSQEEAAKRLGKSQSAIANKLRILRLPSDVLDRLRGEGLTERHGRALLRLESAEEQRMALDFIIDQRMNVSSAEEYIEGLLRGPEEAAPEGEEPASAPERRASRRRSVFVMKDVRLFMNTLSRGLDVMRRGGIDADLTRLDSDKEVVLTVRIAKK